MNDRTGPAAPDFRALFEASPAPYLVLAPDLRIVAVNDAYLRATMTRREEIVGRDLFDVFPDDPDDPSATGVGELRASLDRVLAHGQADAMPVTRYAIRRPAGEGGGFEERYWSPLNTPVLGADGEIAWIIHRVEDVTELVRLRADGAAHDRLAADQQAVIDRLREANAALRSSDERLRIAQRAGGIGTFEWYPDTGRLDVSDEYRRIWGFAADTEITDELLVGLLHPDDRRLSGPARLGSDNPLEYAEYRVNRPDTGEERWIARRGEAMRAPDGFGPRRFVGVAFDITERKRAEARLSASEQRLANVLEAIGDAFYAIDAEERFTLVSRRALEMWGKTAADIVGRTVLEALPGVAAGEPYRALREAMRTGRPTHLEAVSRAVPGRWIEQDVYPTPDGGAAVSFRDVDARKRAEAALRESEERFRTMADSAPALIWTTDDRANVTFANRWYEEVFGRPTDEMLGDGWRATVNADDVESFFAAFLDAFEARRHFKAEVRVWDRQGRLRWLRCEGVPRFDGAGGFLGYTGCNVDVTEAKLASDALEARVAERTRELEQTQAALLQAQKMEAVGQLTGGIAHDFNNLLTAVVGGLDMIRKASDGRTRRLAENALRAAERGAKLTGQLLAFSRTQRLTVAPVRVNAVIQGMRDLLTRTIGSAAAIRTALDPHAGSALTDAHQLELAILNLAINARDAMGEKGGTISIATATVHIGSDRTAASDLPPGQYVAVSVEDDGPGMPADVLSRAFDPFFTTKPVGQGTGLGLSQVYGIARQSGGTVRIDSEPGRGTLVRILLPRAFGAAPSVVEGPEAGEGPPAEAATARRRATVLVVDDDPEVRGFLAESLDALGFGVLQAAGGAAGLEVLERHTPDILLVDFAMPGMNGAELAAAALRSRPGLPIIFATGYASTAALEAIAVEAPVLRKPFGLNELAAALDAALAS